MARRFVLCRFNLHDEKDVAKKLRFLLVLEAREHREFLRILQ